jgi:MOSC domain-containing protein YiiM
MKLSAAGKILELFISKEGVSGRIPVDAVMLDPKGVRLDKFYDKNIQRSVLLTSIESYHLAQKEGIEMEYGVLGENILMDFNPYLLDAGTQLKIGTALLEISQYCTMCDHLTAIDPILPQLLAQDRGIFAKVIKEGEVKKGDSIYLVEKEEEE